MAGKRMTNIDDVRAVMSVQQDKLNWKYIEEWCGRHDTLKLMESIRRSIQKSDQAN
jgi:hypothetical protein